MFTGTPELHGHHSNEPMMMGSPASPTSPHPHQAQCLPGFLLGDSLASPSPRIWAGSGQSPPRSGQRQASFTSPNLSGVTGHTTPRLEPGMRGKDKSGAPPIRSLNQMSSPAPSNVHSPFVSFNQTQSRGPHTPGMPAPHISGFSQGLHDNSVYGTPGGDSFNMSRTLPTSPAQLDPFHTQGDSLTVEDVATLDSTWVTVFGFPPAAASFVLQQFSQYGNILKCVMSTDGNWIHLHYQSRIQAKKALSKNGKVLGNSIMVGVTPCIDMKVMESDKENDGNPNFSQNMTPNTTFSTPVTGAKHTPIRPLTAAYRAARSETEVLQNNQVPQKNNGFVTKAMEYMFGW